MDTSRQNEQLYRDSISTVDKDGKRVWVYPKKPKGKLHRGRVIVSVILLFLLFSGAFIKVNGMPLFLFNLFERKFILFGMAFWPQDFFIFVLAMIAFVVFIILFTVIYGRVWCGWACPQTIFMEMVFRKIEYWIEGDANQQRKLKASPWNRQKILKKGGKHLIFGLLSLLISHLLMAYLVGVEEVKEIISRPPTENLTGFIGLVVFTGIFYWVFAFFREQACIAVCPYGRLQGVFLDKKSIVVAYDYLRGEKRVKLNKKAKVSLEASGEKAGDCVDCSLCVQVCPTGIDIRNGTQLECVNCTACIDACDQVMEKIGRPKKLIRYDSLIGIETAKKWTFNPRIVAYTSILVLILSVLTYLIASRSDIETTIQRVPGMLYQEQENGQISNLYNIQLVNKTFQDKIIRLQLKNHPDGTIRQVGSEGEILVKAGELFTGVFFIELPKKELNGMKSSLTIQVYQENEIMDEVNTNFMGPAN
ncbi:cytochrome c oxidase accessory protein CcoG [Xanthovirga aplysinae]|uniref:cytochrome c oxidase accessory protein CcoG n=1 Tax=Xanthovirga aplysinae TaxID=2529853 RepID=UPI0012BC734C|nr:cytochrome c oxidase accessory protein CcoG [Xanthovirga aplysinae]MTI31567.1 cytochrome c oxidase accessory protein CcoG [Xanthovirga aplysinae]